MTSGRYIKRAKSTLPEPWQDADGTGLKEICEQMGLSIADTPLSNCTELPSDGKWDGKPTYRKLAIVLPPTKTSANVGVKPFMVLKDDKVSLYMIPVLSHPDGTKTYLNGEMIEVEDITPEKYNSLYAGLNSDEIMMQSQLGKVANGFLQEQYGFDKIDVPQEQLDMVREDLKKDLDEYGFAQGLYKSADYLAVASTDANKIKNVLIEKMSLNPLDRTFDENAPYYKDEKLGGYLLFVKGRKLSEAWKHDIYIPDVE